MSSWLPPPYLPARAATTTCTEALVDQYFGANCQLGGCVEFAEGGVQAACGVCLEPSSLDATELGPVVTFSVGAMQSARTNGAGCVELKGQLDCATKIWAADECARQACLATCHPANASEYVRYSACEETARATTCSTYSAEAICVSPTTASACNGPDVWRAIGRVFCAGG